MFEQSSAMIIKSLMSLMIIIAILLAIWLFTRKNLSNLWQKFNSSEKVKITNFIILPNRAQLLHIEDQEFAKKYSLIVQTNGEVKVLDSKLLALNITGMLDETK